jgi:hypothetical protein
MSKFFLAAPSALCKAYCCKYSTMSVALPRTLMYVSRIPSLGEYVSTASTTTVCQHHFQPHRDRFYVGRLHNITRNAYQLHTMNVSVRTINNTMIYVCQQHIKLWEYFSAASTTP